VAEVYACSMEIVVGPDSTMLMHGRFALGDHPKSGHTLSLQNRPTGLAEDVIVLPCRSRAFFARHPYRLCFCHWLSPGPVVLVRQLRGPHLSTCPWCNKRSTMAETAALSPKQLAPAFDGSIRCQQRAGAFVTAHNDFQ
jgi:hypothetical protein